MLRNCRSGLLSHIFVRGWLVTLFRRKRIVFFFASVKGTYGNNIRCFFLVIFFKFCDPAVYRLLPETFFYLLHPFFDTPVFCRFDRGFDGFYSLYKILFRKRKILGRCCGPFISAHVRSPEFPCDINSAYIADILIDGKSYSLILCIKNNRSSFFIIVCRGIKRRVHISASSNEYARILCVANGMSLYIRIR